MNKDVLIETFNHTRMNLYFVFFYRDSEAWGMFTQLFPTAWQVIPITKGIETTMSTSPEKQNPFIYPQQTQIGCVAHQAPYIPGTQYLMRESQPKSNWVYSRNGDFDQLEFTGNHDEDFITLTNDAPYLVDAALCKNQRPLLVHTGNNKQGISQGDTVNLQLIDRLCVMWSSSKIEAGSFLTESQINNSAVYSIDLQEAPDLEGKAKLVLYLAEENSGGLKKIWSKEWLT